MVHAIKRHATEVRPVRDGHPILSDHVHGDRNFYLLTAADRRWTAIPGRGGVTSSRGVKGGDSGGGLARMGYDNDS
jgi:hypothetical protein